MANDDAIIKVCDLINQGDLKGMAPYKDNEIVADCTDCEKPIRLSDCKIHAAAETKYFCPECGDILVVISCPHPSGKPWPGRGYRLGDLVLRNAVQLRLQRGNIELTIPVSSEALTSKHPDESE